MAISLKPEHLKRYKDLALLLMKYGRADLVRSAGLDAAIEGADDGQVSPAKMEELASDIEKMGPTFIKLAQLMSTRADLLPQPYIDALTRLQDKVEPFPFTEVEQIVNSELGVRISKAFAEFDCRRVAAALGKIDLHGYRLAEHLFQAYMQQILVDGFFHADPHPGNVFLTDDRRIALLDLGMTANLTPSLQEDLLKLVLATAEGRAEDALTVIVKIGEKLPEYDERRLASAVADLI